MDVKAIEKLMDAMQTHGVTQLCWKEGESSLKLSRDTPQAAPAAYGTAPQVNIQAAKGQDVSPSGSVVSTAANKEVISPMVGTFHPAPGKAVKSGVTLKKGEVLCIIEAMKLMNDIVMEEDGEIVHFALKEGDMVEYGQVLAQYK